MIQTELFPYQRTGVRFLRDCDGTSLLADEVGLGKAQPTDCKILTPSGWVPIGTLQPGDQVIGSAGTPITVTGVFPQGVRPVFRVQFRDGAATRCCSEHLWATRDTVQKHRGSPYKAKSLETIQKRFKKPNGTPLHYIPIVSAVQLAPVEVSLDPYLVGYLLANGGLSGHLPYVSTPDDETIERLRSVLPEGVDLRHSEGVTYRITKNGPHSSASNPLTDELRKLGMMGKLSPEKTIPEVYVHNSPEVRLAILQGLMDGDGYASTDGVVQFTSTSEKMTRQIRDLVWSLGGTCTWSEKESGYRDAEGIRVTCQRAYTLTLAMPRGTTAFRLQRKRDRASKREKYEPTRAMTDITPDGEAECVCISVDAPDHLYVTDDYIVTHNTVQALYYCWRYLPKDPPGPIVVTVPAYLKINWKREVQKHFGSGVSVEALYKEKVPLQKQKPLDPNQIYVVNYDILTPDNWRSRTNPPKDSWVSWLAELKPRQLIGDEAHLLSNPSAARTRAFKWLSKRCPRTMLLTGTPLPNKPENLWSLLNILSPTEFDSRWDFCNEYSTPVRTHWGWYFRGAKNLDLLHQRISHLMLRRRKADVLSELPAVTHSVMPFECDLREYRRAEVDAVEWLYARDPAAGMRAAKAAQLQRLNILMGLAAKAKMKQATDWVSDFVENSGRKLLVGAIHYETTDALMGALGKSAVLVDGRCTEKQKVAGFDKFNRDRDCRVMVANIHAAGTGWSCTATSDVLLLEMPWRPGDVTQFAGRVHGVSRGQEGHGAHVRYIVAADTVEEDLCDGLQKKDIWASQAVDGTKDAADLNLQDFLLSSLAARCAGR